jgi:hypothetical protein
VCARIVAEALVHAGVMDADVDARQLHTGAIWNFLRAKPGARIVTEKMTDEARAAPSQSSMDAPARGYSEDTDAAPGMLSDTSQFVRGAVSNAYAGVRDTAAAASTSASRKLRWFGTLGPPARSSARLPQTLPTVMPAAHRHAAAARRSSAAASPPTQKQHAPSVDALGALKRGSRRKSEHSMFY